MLLTVLTAITGSHPGFDRFRKQGSICSAQPSRFLASDLFDVFQQVHHRSTRTHEAINGFHQRIDGAKQEDASAMEEVVEACSPRQISVGSPPESNPMGGGPDRRYDAVLLYKPLTEHSHLGPMRMRLRLRKVWANHHPILGATYTGDGVGSGPSSANLSSGDLEDAPKIDPTNLYIDYGTLSCYVDA